ncbi:MAG: DUF350 domain-containing protein [Ignavibacteriales bacterium]|nr:DUF350 domain-containing protein [Ignavibacteriales bacterium]
MNLVLLISGIVQIILSLLLGVLFIYAAFRVFSALTKGVDELSELKQKNTAVGILISAIFISVTFIIKSAMDPSLIVFTNTLRNPEAGLQQYLTTFGIMLSHFIVSGVLGFAAIFIALQFFILLSRDLNEMEELKRNNIAVGILMAAVVVCVALLVQPGIKTLLDALIPYPETVLRNISR